MFKTKIAKLLIGAFFFLSIASPSRADWLDFLIKPYKGVFKPIIFKLLPLPVKDLPPSPITPTQPPLSTPVPPLVVTPPPGSGIKTLEYETPCSPIDTSYYRFAKYTCENGDTGLAGGPDECRTTDELLKLVQDRCLGLTGPTNSVPSPTGAQTPVPTSGTPDESKEAQIQRVIDLVSESKIREDMNTIIGTTTRYSSSQGYITVSDSISNYFKSINLDSVEFQDFTARDALPPFESIQSRNIIGTIVGKKPNDFYIVGGHLDSTSARTYGSNYKQHTDPAPGATDNGSGSAAVMEIARAIKESGIQLNYSIQFVLFGGEEEGILGSNHYVTRKGNKTFKGMINLDMIGYQPTPSKDCAEFGYKDFSGSNILSDKAVEIDQKYSIGLSTKSVSRDAIKRSDHQPFWDNNIPAVFGYGCGLITGTSTINVPSFYHTNEDTLDRVNFSQLTKSVKVVAGTLTSFAVQN